ncbi:hypothetical protein Aph01nite_42490 [Acrocarpospora phusangensis]|uniref:Uncharacterized protein n=1 Tax=Acrocarpospora phusangensis TaxID=1070424 RepID=A0A919ULF8_9ACTN|nr:hypothetical protein [Acrocarpospora phusangensis]GIH25939.1 hypothetical protein Aph01nite_42490 [Acrocarpospora phusangensis]
MVAWVSQPVPGAVTAIVLIILSALASSRLLKVLLFGAAVGVLVLVATNLPAGETPGAGLVDGLTADGVTGWLRDPLVALVLAVVLAFIGTQSGWRLVKTVMFCAAVAAVCWTAVTYSSGFSAVAGAIATIVVWLIIALTVITVVLVIGVLVLAARSDGRSDRDLATFTHRAAAPIFADDPDDPEVARLLRVNDCFTRLSTLLEEAADFDDSDLSIRETIGAVTSFYFSGLRPLMPEIRTIHKELNAELAELGPRYARMSRARFYLPTRGEWRQLTAEEGLIFPYPVLRLLLLNRRWREVATITYKWLRTQHLIEDHLDLL